MPWGDVWTMIVSLPRFMGFATTIHMMVTSRFDYCYFLYVGLPSTLTQKLQLVVSLIDKYSVCALLVAVAACNIPDPVQSVAPAYLRDYLYPMSPGEPCTLLTNSTWWSLCQRKSA